jgi:putative membrane protein
MNRSLYIAASLITALLMMGCDGNYGHMGGGGWNHMMNSGYGYGYGGIFMGILIIIVIGVVVYFIIQSTRTKTSGGPLQETPLDILKKRYAKGDISKEEYERIKNDL